MPCQRVEESIRGNKGERVSMNEKIAESLGVVHTHTHTLLLNKKMNKSDIEKATRLSILC